MSRYNTNFPLAISAQDPRYDYLFEGRDTKIIYVLAMDQMNALSGADRRAISTRRYTWRPYDQYWKVAQRFYGDTRLWFIIAYYNKAPTEFHLKPGQDIFVPTSAQAILDKLGL